MNAERKVGGEKDRLTITPLGLSVLDFLLKHFDDLFLYDFTARMETRLDRIAEGQEPWKQVLQSAAKKPRKILSITYFLSAQIKVRRGQLQAWDCSVALNMLLVNLKCITPNVRIIENVGDDEFAHHTFDNIDLARGRIENIAAASTVLRNDLESEKATNKAIRQRIYNMKMRQVFSPMKALLCRRSS